MQFTRVIAFNLRLKKRYRANELANRSRILWQQRHSIADLLFRHVVTEAFRISDGQFGQRVDWRGWQPSRVIDDFVEKLQPVVKADMMMAENLADNTWLECSHKRKTGCVHDLFQSEKYLWDQGRSSPIQIVD